MMRILPFVMLAVASTVMAQDMASSQYHLPRKAEGSSSLLVANASDSRSIPASKRREIKGSKVREPASARRTPAPTPDRSEAQKASDTVLTLYERLQDDLRLVYPQGLMSEFAVKDALQSKALIERIEAAQEAYQQAISAFHTQFSENPETQQKRLRDWGIERGSRARSAYRSLSGHRDKLAKARGATGNWLVEKAHWWLDINSDSHPDQQMQELQRIQAVLEAAAPIVPGDQVLADIRASMNERIAVQQGDNDAAVAAARWPGRVKNFTGPGNAADLEATVKSYLEQDRSWGKSKSRDNTILKVAIKGDWVVAERDVWGNVLSWRLPVWVAMTHSKLKQRGMAQVIDLSMVTQQGVPNNQNKRPPFDGPWVGNSFYMKLDNLP